uniref:uncharacterized protein LOC120326674 isoform X1 n=1 Tax=Styela clava TaxID=7725 RepID=UPI00193ADD0A|nr:uncharacterized protein LOC120326674 isoform X1 [Styela clava]
MPLGEFYIFHLCNLLEKLEILLKLVNTVGGGQLDYTDNLPETTRLPGDLGRWNKRPDKACHGAVLYTCYVYHVQVQITERKDAYSRSQELRRIFSKHMVIQQCLDSQGLVSIRRRNKNQQSSVRLEPPFQQYNSEKYAFLQFNLNNVRGKYRDSGGRCGYFGRECCGACQRQVCGRQREGATCLGTV